MRNLFISMIAVVALGLVGVGVMTFPQSSWAGSETSTEQSQTFTIEHMTCATCPITVKKAMQRVDGVKSIDVDFESKTATAIFDPAKTSAQQIAQASTDVGYPATLIK